MQPQTPSSASDAPAPPSPDVGAEPQVEIALGPDVSIYPESLRPPADTAPTAPPDEALEPDETSAPEVEPDIAGAASASSLDKTQGEPQTRGARRKAAEDAYQRGLAEGRAVLEREQQQRFVAEQQAQIQRDAAQRVEQLFVQARSPDRNVQQQAWSTILQMYDGNRQAQALMSTTRQQVLAEMARDFEQLKNADGVSPDDYQQLFGAGSASELVKRAMAIGKKAHEEQIARLEAELQGLRGRLVGSRATPEAHNGASADLSAGVSIDDYLAMSPKEARKLSSAQIDALTAQLQTAAERNGRSY